MHDKAIRARAPRDHRSREQLNVVESVCRQAFSLERLIDIVAPTTLSYADTSATCTLAAGSAWPGTVAAQLGS